MTRANKLILRFILIRGHFSYAREIRKVKDADNTAHSEDVLIRLRAAWLISRRGATDFSIYSCRVFTFLGHFNIIAKCDYIDTTNYVFILYKTHSNTQIHVYTSIYTLSTVYVCLFMYAKVFVDRLVDRKPNNADESVLIESKMSL